MSEYKEFLKKLKIWDYITFVLLFLIIWFLYIYFIGSYEFKTIKELKNFFNQPICNYFEWFLVSLFLLLVLIYEIIYNKIYFWFKYKIFSILKFLQNHKKINLILHNWIQICIKILDLYIYTLIIAFIFYTLTNFYNYQSISLDIINKIFTDRVFLTFAFTWFLVILIKNLKEVLKIIFTNKIFNIFNIFIIIILASFSRTYNIAFLEYFLTNYFFWTYLVLYVINTFYTQINSSNDYQVNFYHKSFKDAIKDNKSYIETYQKFKENLKNYWSPNTINLNVDQPIQSQYEDDDILWHKDYAKNIFDLIYWFDMSTINGSYSIWIVWEWGIWKSWIVNMIKNDWMKSRNDMVFYEFNPWNFEKNDLVNNFFSDLSKELEISNMWCLLNQYSNLISSVDTTWIINNILSIIFPEKSIHEIKEEINKKLESYNKKIIISIDDLDRCTPDEVMIMLNIIKNLWNFKNIIYLVSYDKDNVFKVLKNKDFWEDYLDKIINTEVFISEPSNEQLKDYYQKWVDNIFKTMYKNYIDDKEDVKINIEEIFLNLFSDKSFTEVDKQNLINNLWNLKDFFLLRWENLRFIKKYLNQLNIILQKNYNEVTKKEFILYLKDDKINSKYQVHNLFFIIAHLNYIKIKDYNFYSYLLSNMENLLSKMHMSWLSSFTKSNLYKFDNNELLDNNKNNKYKEFIEILWFYYNDIANKYEPSKYSLEKINYILKNFT